MSCFICNENIFKSVAKVCWNYGVRQVERSLYPLTLMEMNDFIDEIAELNCRNVAVRYCEEQQEPDVEKFDDIPFEPINVQNIKDCDCWMYQTCDNFDSEPLFEMVKDATEWAKSVTPYTDDEWQEANWG